MCFDLSGIAVLKERMHSYPDLREEKIFPEGGVRVWFQESIGEEPGQGRGMLVHKESRLA